MNNKIFFGLLGLFVMQSRVLAVKPVADIYSTDPIKKGVAEGITDDIKDQAKEAAKEAAKEGAKEGLKQLVGSFCC